MKVARLAKGWRLIDLAAEVGRSAPLISMIENGYVAKAATRQKIAQALGKPVRVLWPELSDE